MKKQGLTILFKFCKRFFFAHWSESKSKINPFEINQMLLKKISNYSCVRFFLFMGKVGKGEFIKSDKKLIKTGYFEKFTFSRGFAVEELGKASRLVKALIKPSLEESRN